jgi:dethiobiotin synthetase
VTALPRVVFVTGTDTDVGKTVATAALAAALQAGGAAVACYKPVQAGTCDGQGDIDVIRRLGGPALAREGIRLAEPMAPAAAAAIAGVTLPEAARHVTAIARLAGAHDHVLVEGSGGLLVRLDSGGATLADLAAALAPRAAAILVCRSGLGTLNHTELTIEALARRQIPVAGILIGSWPREPTAIDLSNREYLGALRVPLLGALPERAAALGAAVFRARAPRWLAGIAPAAGRAPRAAGPRLR